MWHIFLHDILIPNPTFVGGGGGEQDLVLLSHLFAIFKFQILD